MRLRRKEVVEAPGFVADPDKPRVRLSLDVSQELNELLETLSSEIDGSKSDVLRKGIVLMEILVKARKAGKKFGVAEKDQVLVTEIVGL